MIEYMEGLEGDTSLLGISLFFKLEKEEKERRKPSSQGNRTIIVKINIFGTVIVIPTNVRSFIFEEDSFNLSRGSKLGAHRIIWANSIKTSI